MDAPVLADFDMGRDHGLPGMSIGIGEISAIAAIVGFLRGSNEFRPLRKCEFHHRIDFLRRPAVPRQCDAAKGRWPRRIGQRGVLREFMPGE
jgi:hypothetical protein